MHNAHVELTRCVITLCRRRNVRAFVHTSSTGAWHDAASDVRGASESDTRQRYGVVRLLGADGPSAYSATKRQAEVEALREHGASDGGHRPLSVCALRLPGLYGVGDAIVSDPLLRGSRIVPGRRGAIELDFCYVENAAHAHVWACLGLLADLPGLAGSALHISDDQPGCPIAMFDVRAPGSGERVACCRQDRKHASPCPPPTPRLRSRC